MPSPSSSIDDRDRSIDVEDRSSRDLLRMCGGLAVAFAFWPRRLGSTRRGPSAGVAGSVLGVSSATCELKLDEYITIVAVVEVGCSQDSPASLPDVHRSQLSAMHNFTVGNLAMSGREEQSEQ